MWELRTFRDYLHKHGLREQEVDSFGNCLFLSITRHVTNQEDMYSTETPGDPKTLYSKTARSIRDLTLEHILEHSSTFEGSFDRRSTVITTTDLTTVNTEIDTATENEPTTTVGRERDD